MCIICNCADQDAADAYLRHVEQVRLSMRLAEAALLKVADAAHTEADGARYRRTHKALVRRRRDWNRVEQRREGSANPTTGAK